MFPHPLTIFFQGSRDSSSDDSGHRGRHHDRRNRGSKRSKVEYITTFGNDEDDEEEVYDGVEKKGFALTHFPGMSSGRPSDAASKVAASVVSSLFKNSTARESKTQDNSRTKPSAPSTTGLATLFFLLYIFDLRPTWFFIEFCTKILSSQHYSLMLFCYRHSGDSLEGEGLLVIQRS